MYRLHLHTFSSTFVCFSFKSTVATYVSDSLQHRCADGVRSGVLACRPSVASVLIMRPSAPPISWRSGRWVVDTPCSAYRMRSRVAHDYPCLTEDTLSCSVRCRQRRTRYKCFRVSFCLSYFGLADSPSLLHRLASNVDTGLIPGEGEGTMKGFRRPSVTADEPESKDEGTLAELGYKQELRRDWGLLHNFGVSFSIISVIGMDVKTLVVIQASMLTVCSKCPRDQARLAS